MFAELLVVVAGCSGHARGSTGWTGTLATKIVL